MKKLAIIGRGTAGCYSVSHFKRWTDWQIDWYFDENTKPQSVGEGSDLTFPLNLYDNIGFTPDKLPIVDGFYKSGIYKSGWANGDALFHPFGSPTPAIHFSATKLQDYIFSELSKTNIRFVNANVGHDNIDADYILDCSGFSNELDKFNMATNIAVNSVYVTQCFWDYPRFDYTLTIARPWGWVFGIPLRNRCSIGYMYNDQFASLDTIKEDVKAVFDEYNLTPSDTTNNFSFVSYTRKENYSNRVAYNGNASFFLEPLEATSLAAMDKVHRWAFDVWQGAPVELINNEYKKYLYQIENIIMSHYANGSIYKNEFWDMAQEKGQMCRSRMLKDPYYKELMNGERLGYGTWVKNSFLIHKPIF